MPLIGWLVGNTVVDFISAFDHWLVFILLAAIGGKMIWESIHTEDTSRNNDISKWSLVLFLALATSIDALAAGLSFAFLDMPIAISCSVIGIIAFFISIAGFLTGRKTRSFIGKFAGILGGVILIAIGLRTLISHIL